jgi:hypothetical protein
MSRARFLYFIPNCSGIPDLKRIGDAGLQHAFPSVGQAGGIMNGPGSESGHMLAYGQDPDIGYRPTQQAWIKTITGSWVGMDRKNRPGPVDLERETIVEGSSVVLADGNEWHVPILRFMNGDTRFPQVLTIGEDGHAQYIVRPEYRAIYELANDMVHKSLKGEGGKFSADDHMMLATEALKQNYRIGPYEITLLELIDSVNVQKVADAALDGPRMRELVEDFKKKLSTSIHSRDSGTGVSESVGTIQPTQI